MRRWMAVKQLLRAPLKTILTFLLIAAASFALFSRVTDYTVTKREVRNAEGFYSGVAALDNIVPDILLTDLVGDNTGVGMDYENEDKPWPSEEQLEEFASLPGVTLVDTRYATAGLVGDYKRLVDKSDPYDSEKFVIEGVYCGFEDQPSTQDYINLIFDDARVLAGDISYSPEDELIVESQALEDYIYWKNPYPRAYWEKLEKGSRCLLVGYYKTSSGKGLSLNPEWLQEDIEGVRVIDGLADDYLETEEFALYRNLIEICNNNLRVYDITYTSDTRAIPWFNERSMVMAAGRHLTPEDTKGCVVSEKFLKMNKCSIGDTLSVRLGDTLGRQRGTQTNYVGRQLPKFEKAVELEIVGAYRIVADEEMSMNDSEWSYTDNAIFVPFDLLPVEVPEDYETRVGEYSVLIEDAHDIEAFLEASEPLVTKMDVNMRFSDGGWTKIKDSFETSMRTSLITMVLYVLGAALALLLAVYLYVGRNKKAYAVMRTLGVPAAKAQNSIVFPLIALSVIAIPAGGAAGLVYAGGVAEQALAGMMETAPYGYVMSADIQIGTIILCLLIELAFTSFVTLMFLRQMKKTPPLELLQEGILRAGAGKKPVPEAASGAAGPVKAEIAKLPSADEMPVRRNYGAVRQISAYVGRHMHRSAGRTLVSLILAAVLTAGIGMFVMVQLMYQDTYQEVDVKGKALGFSSENVAQIAADHLVRDLYYRGKYFVRIDGGDAASDMVFTNDIDRYLTESNEMLEYEITYAKGYDASALAGEEPMCLIGKDAADKYGLKPGGEVQLLADTMHAAMHRNFGDDPELLATRLAYATKTYRVAGVVDTNDPEMDRRLFSAINNEAERLYSQPFIIDYSEFFLADNNRASDLERHLQDMKDSDYFYGSTSSFYIDTEALRAIGRICSLLDSLFPIAVAAAVLIGLFGPGLVIMQSAKEAAFLRVLGTTKKRTRSMMVLEQMILCIAGTLLVAGALLLYHQGRFLRGFETLSACWGLYLLGSICGAIVSSVLVTRHKVLELLHVKE